MKIIKNGKIAALSLVMMLVVAGYSNYKYDPEREKDLGKTVYVNAKDNFAYEDVDIYSNENVNKNDTNANNTTEEESSIAVFKYDRDNMFSELSENYTNIIQNENTSKEQANVYQQKLSELISKKNLITMVENVIKSKGIEDLVIIPTSNDNINVVVKSKEALKDEDVAKIQQIIVDQLGANANKLSITCTDK